VQKEFNVVTECREKRRGGWTEGRERGRSLVDKETKKERWEEYQEKVDFFCGHQLLGVRERGTAKYIN